MASRFFPAVNDAKVPSDWDTIPFVTLAGDRSRLAFVTIGHEGDTEKVIAAKFAHLSLGIFKRRRTSSKRPNSRDLAGLPDLNADERKVRGCR